MKKDKNIEEILSEFDTLFNHDDSLGKALVLFESDPTHAGCTQRPIWKEYRAWLKTALQKAKQQGRDEIKKELLDESPKELTLKEAEKTFSNKDDARIIKAARNTAIEQFKQLIKNS